MPNFEAYIPADFVRPMAVEETTDHFLKVTFPDGFVCYCHSGSDEVALIYNEVLVKQEYFSHGLSVEGASCVLDVGANVGIFTLAAKMKAPNAVIYSFEPIPDTFQVLQKNVLFHNHPDVHLFNVAVGSQDHAQRTFTFYPHMAGNSTAVPAIKATQRPMIEKIFGQENSDYLHESVSLVAPVRTLSSVIREQGINAIDYLKIDVEGDEIAVLDGIEELHWPMIQQVAVETHSEQLRLQVRDRLAAHNFDVFTDLGLSSPVGVSDVYARRR